MRRERTNIVSWVFIGDDKYIENGTNSIAIHIDTYINIIHLMIGKKGKEKIFQSKISSRRPLFSTHHKRIQA